MYSEWPENTSIACPGGGVERSYNEGGALKACENDTEYDIMLSRDIGGAIQAYDADLTTWAGVTPSANGQSLVSAANYAAMRTALDLEAGTDFNAYDADLTTWAGVTPGTGVATALGSAVDTSGGVATNNTVKAKYLSGTEADFYGTLLDPQAIYAVDATNHAVTLINDVPAAFTITKIKISCDADPTTELTATFQHKAAGVGYGAPTTIEAVLTVNGAVTIDSGIDDATIPAGTKVFVALSDPDDALNECSWQIEGDWD